MSAIVKPLIQSTKVKSGASDLVNVEMCSSITKVDVPAATGINREDEFKIVFQTMNDDNSPIYVDWKYKLVADRDADYAAIVALAATVLV